MTDIFVIYHNDIDINNDIKSDIKYFKCNNLYKNKYTNFDLNIIEQTSEYQYLQPSFSEFTAFKMILDSKMIESDWICTLQYDHKINSEIVDYIKSTDKILIFSPFGNGVNAVYEQNYTFGNENFMDWILKSYNSFFNKTYVYDDIKEIPLAMCSAVKVKKELFYEIMEWIFTYDTILYKQIGSNISWHPRWEAMLAERMFAMAVSFSILEGNEYEIYTLEHHS